MNQTQKQIRYATLSTIALSLALTGCSGGGGSSGGGGGGGSGSLDNPLAASEVKTIATTGRDGSYSRVDILDGGAPVQIDGDVGTVSPNPEKQALLKTLMGKMTDLDRNLTDSNLDGIADADTGFDEYSTGLEEENKSGQRIYAANNVYDLFQTTTGNTGLVNGGRPVLINPISLMLGGPPFNGGDVNELDGFIDGGPGLFSNLPVSLIPTLPSLPNTMGPGTGSGRGPSFTDQHQFIQISFPFNLSRDSLFNPASFGNSFLGDSVLGAAPNVFIENHWVSRIDPPITDDINVVDHTIDHVHVPGVAVIGGVTAVPLTQGFGTLTTIDPDLSNVPEGAKVDLLKPNVFTYIAHEAPALITTANPPSSPLGYITGTGLLVLPDPTDVTGLGGRVFGADATLPSSVNDFGTDGPGAQSMGFMTFKFSSLRSGNKTIDDAYYHSFPMDQSAVGPDDPLAVNGSYTRGPAVEFDPVTGAFGIDVFSRSADYLGTYDSTPADATVDDDGSLVPVNLVSTKARFRVDFDKDVVPNSVGFSRRHTIHSVEGKQNLFAFNGNTRPIGSPADQFVTDVTGAPLAPSIYLALNQPTRVAANNPLVKNVNQQNNVTDTEELIFDLNDPNLNPAGENGFFPTQFNRMATLPRGVVPCDIYPVNQNNLQAYIVEPLIDLPPGSTVTLGVCMPGLGMSNNGMLQPELPLAPSNFGNFTRSGTKLTPWQGLTPVGLNDPTVPQKQAHIGNATIIKVNAGPMDLSGLLFFGGTGIAIDTLIDGDPNGDNNSTDGGWNVTRTFRVGMDAERPYVNAPVAPQAIVLGFGTSGMGVLDLAGDGFSTNAPGGGLSNPDGGNKLITSRFLPPAVLASGQATKTNWDPVGSLAGGGNRRAYGVLGRYTSGGCFNCAQTSYESELATGTGIPTGFLTPSPGVNEGSSGFETLSRDSNGSPFLTDADEVGLVRDMLLGNFLDTVYFDTENNFADAGNRRSYNSPFQTGGLSNLISDPPAPNPPPLRFPVGLPHTLVRFDQADLTQKPFLIEGSESFGTDYIMQYNDGTGVAPFTIQTNTYLNLNPTSNPSNPNAFDVPHLPNAGFPSPFSGQFNYPTRFLGTGPMPKSTTAGAVVLVTLNTTGGPFEPGGLQEPIFESRQQIGNFLFVTDGVNKKLHAVNSNNMSVIKSLSLPDPYGMGISPDGRVLYVSNEGANNVSVVVADPLSLNFMTEVKRVTVGEGPRAVAVTPDNLDVFVLNRLGNSISIIDVGTNSVRRTVEQSGINRPNDVCLGPVEFVGGPGFQSGVYHGFISNGGGDNVLIYEGGPSGVAGIGFDNILGGITPNAPKDPNDPVLFDMDNPRGIIYDPVSRLDGFSHTIGAFVAHQDAGTGQAMVSRIRYTKDSSPGATTFNSSNASPGFGEKVFQVVQQYVSDFSGTAFDVALPDFNRAILKTSNFVSNSNLFNAGGVLYSLGGVNLARNSRFPLANNASPPITNGPRWDPDRVYLSIGGGVIDVFDIVTGIHIKTIPTGSNVTVMASYFEQ